jgi:DNA-binding response OmpR family regulator
MDGDATDRAPRILVIDDDDWTVRMVRLILNTLKNRGYRIVTASDGEEGFAKAQAERPDVIITDVIMPKMNGWTLIRRLRSLPEFALVPVIFLTKLDSPKDRIHGFRLGVDEYLPKPFLPEELDLRVVMALRRQAEMRLALLAQAGKDVHHEGPCLQGTLAQVGLASLLTLLDLERKSGVLTVTSMPSDETANIYVRNGRVVGVDVDELDASTREALLRVLSWTAGRFYFTSCPVDRPDEVNSTTTALLMDASNWQG